MVKASEIEVVFREEAGRALATLIRLVGDFEYAEDALQDAFAAALTQWPLTGLPQNPRAWLVNVGRHKAIDRIRRRTSWHDKRRELEAEAVIAAQAMPDEPDAPVFDDDMLRLIFTCCHPALNTEAQVALTLRAVCGLQTGEIARAFLVTDEAMAQRLVRAKAKIRTAKIPYEAPAATMLDARIDGALATIYLVFTEGYAPTEGDALLREDLTREAIRLGRLLHRLMPGRADVQGLLALMLLHDARRHARVTIHGDLVRLEDQDRSLWHGPQIAEGAALVERALRAPGLPSVYAVQAAIAALHAQAASYAATDWRQIAGLYDVLMRLQPSPVVALNHAAAVSMVDGPQAALNLVDSLAARETLAGYHLYPAVRADLLARLQRREEARAAYAHAIALAKVAPERRWLERRLAELNGT
ncbi:RNA polymerase subunit sigma-24 [Afipia sp. P52-10]|nr:RNA polymerase subunit sigma-24 [Afipia sp. P52-10]